MKDIFKRHSIRKFSNGKTISSEDIESILKAGMYAPSSRNLQPWEFIVINDNESEKWLSLKETSLRKILTQSPLSILVCADTDKEMNRATAVMDCSAATMNMLLQATALNLGSLWYGVFPHEKRMKDLSKVLYLPDNIMPVSLVLVGEPAEEKGEEFRFHRKKIHYNQW